MKLAPIVLFTYNRPRHTRQTIEALQKNQYAAESDLIIYSDGPQNQSVSHGVEETRLYIKTITGFKSIIIVERDINRGLANNIIDGVTTVVNAYERVIVLEDDLLTSPFFLKYMNEALNLYEDEQNVACIHGYIYPVKGDLPETFFIKGADCWGWATWKRAWDIFEVDGSILLSQLLEEKRESEFDFDGSYPYMKMLRKQIKGKVGSWAIRWYASAFLKNKFTLYPGHSLVYYNGSDGSGTNSTISNEFVTELAPVPIKLVKMPVEESILGRRLITHYFRYTMRIEKLKSFLRRIINKL